MDIEEKNTDVALVKSFKAGSKTAFDGLINRHGPKMFKVAFGLLGSKEDAEEIVQDAFVKAYNHLKDFRGDSSFSTWIYRIVINLARNRYHFNKRRGSELNVSLTDNRQWSDSEGLKKEIDVPDTSTGPEGALVKTEDENKIMDSIAKLPENLREMIKLRHIEEMSYEQMADALECNIGTVKSRLARARDALCGIIEKA